MRRWQEFWFADVPPHPFLGRVIYAQAYTMGFRDSFVIIGLVFTLALIPAWIMGRVRPGPAAAPLAQAACGRPCPATGPNDP